MFSLFLILFFFFFWKEVGCKTGEKKLNTSLGLTEIWGVVGLRERQVAMASFKHFLMQLV